MPLLPASLKTPSAALRCILRHCGVPKKVRLIPQDLRALHMGPLTKPAAGYFLPEI